MKIFAHGENPPNLFTIHFFGHWGHFAEIFRAFSEKRELDTDFANCIVDLIFYHDVNFDKLTDERSERILKKFDVEKIKMLFAIKRADLPAQSPAYHHMLASLGLQEKRLLVKIKGDRI